MGAGAHWQRTLGVAALVALAASARAAPPPATLEEAKRLAKLSIREYEALEYDHALADAVKAFELSGAPELLYNLGQCHRALGHWKEAELSYLNYLHEKPKASNRDLVLTLIGEMRAKQAVGPTAPARTQAPVPAPAAAVAPSSPAPAAETTATAAPSRSHALAWTLWSASVVAGGFAIAGAVRVANYDSGTSPQTVAAYQQESAGTANASNWANAGIVLGALALAGVVGGVLTW